MNDSVATKGRRKSSNDRRAAILAATAELITEHGYDGTSLSAICERAACSKSVIYDHFGSKKQLLAALSQEVALELSRALLTFHLQDISLKTALSRYARMVLTLVLAESHIAVLRATIAASWKHPDIGPAYYQVGAGAAYNALAAYLKDRASAGELRMDDPKRSAGEFLGLLLWDRILAQLVGADGPPTAEEIETRVDIAVTTFLDRHAA